MYESKYKHKHADRRARLFSPKLEVSIKAKTIIDDKPRMSLEEYLNRQYAQDQLTAQRQGLQSQQQGCNHLFGGLLGAATLFGGAK